MHIEPDHALGGMKIKELMFSIDIRTKSSRYTIKCQIQKNAIDAFPCPSQCLAKENSICTTKASGSYVHGYLFPFSLG